MRNNRIIKALTFVMLFALMICSLSLNVFAHDETTSWFDGKVGQIVGFCVAGVLFVAIVIFIIWWIPKESDKKGKKDKK